MTIHPGSTLTSFQRRLLRRALERIGLTITYRYMAGVPVIGKVKS